MRTKAYIEKQNYTLSLLLKARIYYKRYGKDAGMMWYDYIGK